MEKENSQELIEERKKKLLKFFNSSQLWVAAVLIIALILGVYIRSLPMTDHGGTPGLWDVTTNNWTLGPDLDPWLFLRQAKTVIETGEYPPIDYMRNVPLGFDNTKETMLLPYMIDWTYHISKIFYSGTTPEYAGVIFPVIMFALTTISFFFFVREIFVGESRKEKTKANLIALVSTFFMIVIPVFLSRTVAGIPEKESAAFFFMFLSFYLFLKAFKSEKKSGYIFGILSAISTALMALIWGGIIFIYITIALSVFITFVLGKIDSRRMNIYTIWYILSITVYLLFSNRETLSGVLTSLSSGLAFFVLFILWFDKGFWKIKTVQEKFRDKKVPPKIISITFAIMFAILIAIVILGPGFILEKGKAVHQSIFKPIPGRWGSTVAENRQPYFTEWGSSFGPTLGSIPIMFTLFFIGSILFIYQILHRFKTKERWTLTLGYVIILSAMIFSRYSQTGLLNGENFISKSIYYLGIILFIGIIGKIYIKEYQIGENKFEEISFSYIVLTVLFLLGIFSARGAVRLIMVLAPVASIFVGYISIEVVEIFRRKEKDKKLISGILMGIILIASIFAFVSFYQEVTISSYNMVPSLYNQQWQKAMFWVRENTPSTAVFGHWWDYGYWVQSIGERATVLDGGNAITFWNYYMGRLVLTGDNQKDALEFLYAHNTTHFLIDSTDIGKYGAFSSIGSDKNYDRYSWIETMIQDEQQTMETSNGTTYVYRTGIPLDEDLLVQENGKDVLLPGGRAAVVGGVVTIQEKGDSIIATQPYLVVVYSGKQYNVNLKYIQIDDEFIEFNEGIEAALYVYPSLTSSSNGVSINNLGAAMYLSPRVMKGMLAQKYILDDPFNNFPNFKLVHSEPSAISSILRAQNIDSPDFVYYGGVQGPIKIWEVQYTGDEEFQQKYVDTDASKYLDWQL